MNKETPIFRSLANIEERLSEKLNVEKLADDIHISKYHYQRLFREAVGESVMRYIARRRVFLAGMLREIYAELSAQAKALGMYGAAIHTSLKRSNAAVMMHDSPAL